MINEFDGLAIGLWNPLNKNVSLPGQMQETVGSDGIDRTQRTCSAISLSRTGCIAYSSLPSTSQPLITFFTCRRGAAQARLCDRP
jgi:hypothetical protein